MSNKRSGESCSISCPYSDNGCSYRFSSLDQLVIHTKICLYQPDECPQCGQTVIRRNLGRHADETCENRLANCPDCKKEVPRKEMINHDLNCPSKTPSCKECERELEDREKPLNAPSCPTVEQLAELFKAKCKLEQKYEEVKAENKELRCLNSDLKERILANESKMSELRDSLTKIKKQGDNLRRESEMIKAGSSRSLKPSSVGNQITNLSQENSILKQMLFQKENEIACHTDTLDTLLAENKELRQKRGGPMITSTVLECKLSRSSCGKGRVE